MTTTEATSVTRTKDETEKNDKIEEHQVNGITHGGQPVKPYKLKIVWRSAIMLSLLHLAAFYGLFVFLFAVKWQTNVWGVVSAIFGGIGVTGGAHRLWTHKSYKATLPLKILLMTMYCSNFQNSIYDWVRDHRMHHKYVDTDADPHNAKRGFLFSHVGWLAVRKHKELLEKGKTIWMKDIEEEPVVMFHKKYCGVLSVLGTFVVPTFVPWYFWNESLVYAAVVAMTRYAILLNGAWAINSVAHMYGIKPYDKNIEPTDHSVLSVVAFGEGYHNYHHVFPWDYKTSELPWYGSNLTCLFLDIMAKIGWAYDLKTASVEMIQQRMLRTGDLAEFPHLTEEPSIWGWDDDGMKEEDKHAATRKFRKDE